ncbi:MAG: hypothetical protein QXH03_10610 [Candidatus Bathyarchaeia archaeon]
MEEMGYVSFVVEKVTQSSQFALFAGVREGVSIVLEADGKFATVAKAQV